jgi:hypothetical protein
MVVSRSGKQALQKKKMVKKRAKSDGVNMKHLRPHLRPSYKPIKKERLRICRIKSFESDIPELIRSLFKSKDVVCCVILSDDHSTRGVEVALL